jgi:vacuolar-type H+-ATPase subunit I/STV1
VKYLKTYKQLFEKSSEFISKDEMDELLDKISESGIESLNDIEKNKLELFSTNDKEIIETIEQMGDITNQFYKVNKEIRKLESGKVAWFDKPEGKKLMNQWDSLNRELRPLEDKFKKWGINLGDPRLDKLMRKIRPDAYNRGVLRDLDEKLYSFKDEDVLTLDPPKTKFKKSIPIVLPKKEKEDENVYTDKRGVIHIKNWKEY